MTALTQYTRLESTGLWRPQAGVQRRDVIVSFGDATLVIADGKGQILTHWSLAAVERIGGGGGRATLYSPGIEGEETLEISDRTMVDAIEQVRRSIERRRPQPGRLRWFGMAVSVATVVALGVFWLPNALIQQTLAVVPPVKRSEIGATVLGHMQRLTGPTCRSTEGQAALAVLAARVLGPEAGGRILVLPTEAIGTLYLPGGIIAVSRTLVEDYDDPSVVAGHVLATAAQVQVRDPLEEVLRNAGLRAVFRLFTTGDLPPDAMAAHARRLLSEPSERVSDEILLRLFAAAQLPTGPYARSLDLSGQTVSALLDGDPMRDREIPPVMSDTDWVRLQNICDN
ncbi:hypothetical protein [Roseisalinus antarcticus]|uniref:Peptidase M48 domain-containing protein n=1 Tax=Roseisalinus antarcticus TaxID=254357 RepID=A0A1Y5TR29_9RHOB|nr:hypothetical protein [Roseisalinus antarcticus]SLN70143.1 hypothetical protein ROA7023_03430 [Roseisalinus antarcticus]